MIRIHVASDLHTNSFRNKRNLSFLEKVYEVPDCDFVIFAGDMCDGINCLNDLNLHYKNKLLFWVAGNHDFYGCDINEAIIMFKNFNKDKFNFLYNDHFDLIIKNKKVRIIGSTLWTNYKLYTDKKESIENLCKINKDHKNILYNGQNLKYENLLEEYEKSILFIENKLSDSNNFDYVVVVTHFLPLEKSLSKKHGNKEINPIFATDLSNIITKYNPNLWIHGHSHESCNYVFEKTRIISNPLGYVFKHQYQNEIWKENFIIEL